MSAVSINVTRGSNYVIAEDFTPFKVLSCIPVIGGITSALFERSIRREINNQRSMNSTVIRLIEVKNHYKMASIIQGLIFITCLAIAILYGAIPLTIGGVGIALLGLFIAVQSYRLHHNKTLIKDVAGYWGMRVSQVK